MSHRKTAQGPAITCDSNRVVLHLDMDAFYASVEAKRLGVDPMEVPVGVVQWDGLIAVSYAARPRGVKRGMRTAEARRLCPEILLSQHARDSLQPRDVTFQLVTCSV